MIFEFNGMKWLLHEQIVNVFHILTHEKANWKQIVWKMGIGKCWFVNSMCTLCINLFHSINLPICFTIKCFEHEQKECELISVRLSIVKWNGTYSFITIMNAWMQRCNSLRNQPCTLRYHHFGWMDPISY